MSERKEGWYWVQITPRISADDSGWEALKYEDGLWFMAGRADYLPEGLVFSVGQRIPTPDEMEGWQVVPKEITPEMSREFMCMHNLWYNESGEDEYRPSHTWAALLKAAPKPGDV